MKCSAILCGDGDNMRLPAVVVVSNKIIDRNDSKTMTGRSYGHYARHVLLFHPNPTYMGGTKSASGKKYGLRHFHNFSCVSVYMHANNTAFLH